MLNATSLSGRVSVACDLFAALPKYYALENTSPNWRLTVSTYGFFANTPKDVNKASHHVYKAISAEILAATSGFLQQRQCPQLGEIKMPATRIPLGHPGIELLLYRQEAEWVCALNVVRSAQFHIPASRASEPQMAVSALWEKLLGYQDAPLVDEVAPTVTWRDLTEAWEELNRFEEDARKLKPVVGFCARETWRKKFKPQVASMVGWLANPDDVYPPDVSLRTRQAYLLARTKIFEALPQCTARAQCPCRQTPKA
jgi:hypothetical protein